MADSIQCDCLMSRLHLAPNYLMISACTYEEAGVEPCTEHWSNHLWIGRVVAVGKEAHKQYPPGTLVAYRGHDDGMMIARKNKPTLQVLLAELIYATISPQQ